MPKGEDTRVHVMTSRVCNNNCIFCLEDERIKKHSEVGDFSKIKDILKLNSIRKVNDVLFTSKEPTLNNKLPSMIKIAKDYGYKNISLVTNGRRLSYEPYLKKLIKNGLNRLIISVHGSNANLHDARTRSPVCFEQTLKS